MIQKQDVNTLSRDTDNAHKKLKQIFDKEKEQNHLDQNKLIGELGQQLTDIAIIQAKINATNAVNKVHPDLTGEEREKAIQAEINKSGLGIGGDNRRIIESAPCYCKV